MRPAIFLPVAFVSLTLLRLLPPACPAADAPTKEQLQALYSDFLRGEGYKPEIDKDGDVAFKKEGRTYFIDVGAAQKDPQYFRMALPNIWPIESAEERAKVLAAVDYTNMRAKVCKIHTVGDNVWVSIELFVNTPADFKGIFTRSLNAIDGSTAVFARKMRE